MRRVGYFSLALVLLLSSALTTFPARQVEAVISSCTPTLSPHQVQPGSSNTYQFQLTNTASETIQWLRISRPSADFSLTSASASGWSASLTADNAIFSGGGLDPGASLTLRVNASVSSSASGTKYWSMFVTDDPGGAGQFSCDGDLSVTVGSSTPPTISNVTATNITSSSATINWVTNGGATSQVRYGPTSSYGTTTALNSSLVTNHSVQLTGLSAGSGYHYQVISTNSGGTSTSPDNTFQTSNQATSNNNNTSDSKNSNSTAPSSPSTGSTLVPIKAKPTEKTPPTVSITSNLNGVFKQTPIIVGTASDNEAVARVEYSIDGGKTWLPVDATEFNKSTVRGRTITDTKSVKFSFTPVILEDGDYQVIARATDTSSNQGVSSIHKLVIDNLPPLVGGSLVAIGPQILNPVQDGVIISTVGVDQQITMSAVGGPTSIILTASVTGNEKLTKTFSLNKAKDTGLWTGVISFQQPGTYSIEAKATDGAGNITTRMLNLVLVTPPASIVESRSQKPMNNTSVTIYYYVPQTSQWVVWDGAAYGQANPQKTDNKGQFQYYLPPGKYYMQAKQSGFRPLTSRIFNITKPMPLSTTLVMKKGWFMPVWSKNEISVPNRKIVSNPNSPSSLVGKRAPNFSLAGGEGSNLKATDLNGKLTVLTFLSTWSPAAKEQLGILSQLKKNSDINVVPISLLEQPEKVYALIRLSGYDLPVWVDREGGTIKDYHIQDIPTHIFLDNRGIIKKVMVGVLSREEMLESLAK